MVDTPAVPATPDPNAAQASTAGGPEAGNFTQLLQQLLAQYPMQGSVPATAGALTPQIQSDATAAATPKVATTTSPKQTKATPTPAAGPQSLTDGILNMGQIMPVVHAMVHTGDTQGLGDLLTGKTKFADTNLGKAAAAAEKIGPLLAAL